MQIKKERKIVQDNRRESHLSGILFLKWGFLYAVFCFWWGICRFLHIWKISRRLAHHAGYLAQAGSSCRVSCLAFRATLPPWRATFLLSSNPCGLLPLDISIYIIGSLDGFFGVGNFVYPIISDFCQPHFKWFGFRWWDWLDDSQKLFCISDVG